MRADCAVRSGVPGVPTGRYQIQRYLRDTPIDYLECAEKQRQVSSEWVSDSVSRLARVPMSKQNDVSFYKGPSRLHRLFNAGIHAED
jgi:hypothetical protein